MAKYVAENFADLKPEIRQLHVEYTSDFQNQIYGRDFDHTSPESVSNYLEFLIEVDRKSTPLKSLQGKIWQMGYETGELKGEVYPDVLPAFERWKSDGKTIAIFSSGSILAQKLIFGYSTAGNLNPYISAYFDTTTGPKREAVSYRKIAEALGFSPVEILFVSDIVEELDAAREAGMMTVLLIREENTLLRDKLSHKPRTTFDSI
jgi:enolase-phosphatase E1